MSHDRLVRLERLQYGLVTVAQLTSIGFTEDAIRHLVRTGRLRRDRARVYANPSVVPSYAQRVYSAVLAGGLNAFASHSTAAHMWGFEPFVLDATIEISTVLERRPRVVGARVHRSGLLIDTDVRLIDGIPVASAARTILDLSGRLTLTELGRVVDDALRLRVATLAEIASNASRLRPAPGRSPKRVHELLAARTGAGDSRLEDFVLESIARYRLPMPIRQHAVVVAGRRRVIDLCYPPSMVAVEAQGFAYHGTRSRFDADALRGNELQLAGFRVLEFTSAFDDWTIARHIALALGMSEPTRRPPILTYNAWIRAA